MSEDSPTTEMDLKPVPAQALFFPIGKGPAAAPCYGSPEAIGIDLTAAVDLTIPADSSAVHAIPTGLGVVCPPGTYARIAPRSGLATRFGLHVMAGVIDRDYRGELMAVVVRVGAGSAAGQDLVIKRGDRVAQLVFEQALRPEIAMADRSPDETLRGAGGFGSTGLSTPSTT